MHGNSNIKYYNLSCIKFGRVFVFRAGYGLSLLFSGYCAA